MMQTSDWIFEVFRSGPGLRLKVTETKARRAIEGGVTESDLARIGHWFSPPAPKTDNGVDHKVVEQIITAGIRALAKNLHPDIEGGSTEEMARLNNVADQIRGKLRR